jgi:hypothetical protein
MSSQQDAQDPWAESPEHLGNHFRAIEDTDALPNLPLRDQDDRDVVGWKINCKYPLAFRPCYSDPTLKATHFYCSSCKDWKKDAGTSTNVTTHYDRLTLHGGPQPTQARARRLAQPSPQYQILIFTQGAILSGRPFSDMANPLYRRAIPGLPDLSDFETQCTQFASKTAERLKTRLSGCEFLSLQFDIWTENGQQRFLGVLCEAFEKGAFFECTLGTIPLDPRTCTSAFLAAKLDELLDSFEIAPEACVTDIDAAENPVIDALNELITVKGKHEIQAFPCLCQIVNAAVRVFSLAASEQFPPMRDFAERLGDSLDFTQLCRVPDANRRSVIGLCEHHAETLLEMVQSIADLQNAIISFTETTSDPELAATGQEVSTILESFAVVLQLFEADEPGTISEVTATLRALRATLSQFEGNWENAVAQASAELEGLLKTHGASMEPLCSIATCLNPNYSLGVLFKTARQDQLRADILRQAAEFAARQPPSPARIARGSSPASPSGHARFVSFARVASQPSAHEGSIESRVKKQFDQYLADCAKRGGDDPEVDVIAYWVTQRNAWPELGGYALSILTRHVASVGTARHFPLTPRLTRLRQGRRTSEHLADLAVLLANPDVAEDVIRPD